MAFQVSEAVIRRIDKMRSEKISVCMACYNGEDYIGEQISTILPQLGAEDELIIVDDASKDGTQKVVNSFSDSRISYVKNSENMGVNRSFEKAIKLACNDYIFMADQDDLWTEDRADWMLDQMKTGALLVSGNSEAVDRQGKPYAYDLGSLKERESEEYGKNILKIFTGKAYYYGCAMAFQKSLKSVILPFPEYIESHDLWIAMAANLMKSNAHLEKTVLKRRIHGKNASVVQRSMKEKLYSRWVFMKSYVTLRRRIKHREI